MDLIVYLSFDVGEPEELIVFRSDLFDILFILDLPVLNFCGQVENVLCPCKLLFTKLLPEALELGLDLCLLFQILLAGRLDCIAFFLFIFELIFELLDLVEELRQVIFIIYWLQNVDVADIKFEWIVA